VRLRREDHQGEVEFRFLREFVAAIRFRRRSFAGTSSAGDAAISSRRILRSNRLRRVERRDGALGHNFGITLFGVTAPFGLKSGPLPAALEMVCATRSASSRQVIAACVAATAEDGIPS